MLDNLTYAIVCFLVFGILKKIKKLFYTPQYFEIVNLQICELCNFFKQFCNSLTGETTHLCTIINPLTYLFIS